MKRRTRGFTLLELMVVVAIIGILAAFAVSTWGQNRVQNSVDQWIALNRDAVFIASRRAMATQTPYMVEFKPTSVQWCVVNTTGVPPTYVGVQTTCAGLPANAEQGPLNSSANRDVMAPFYANSADVVDASGTYVAATRNALATSKVLYFGRTGAASTSIVNVMTSSIPDPTTLGFTLYTRRAAIDEIVYRRRMIVYGLSSKVHIIDNY